ncbi:MAG: VOC family protein [Propionibacteriales bacterium]|nr:VOC family protein [Propionibacteriales bacterium]
MAGMETTGSTASIQPRLAVDDAAAAIDFYVAALGASASERSEWEGRIAHCLLTVDGCSFAVKEADDVDPSPRALGGSPVIVTIEVADADAVAERMVEAGATVVFAVDDHGYGYRDGRVKDPFGHQWLISQPLG